MSTRLRSHRVPARTGLPVRLLTEPWLKSFKTGECLQPAFGLCGRCNAIHTDRDLDGEVFGSCIPCQAELVGSLSNSATSRRQSDEWFCRRSVAFARALSGDGGTKYLGPCSRRVGRTSRAHLGQEVEGSGAGLSRLPIPCRGSRLGRAFHPNHVGAERRNRTSRLGALAELTSAEDGVDRRADVGPRNMRPRCFGRKNQCVAAPDRRSTTRNVVPRPRFARAAQHFRGCMRRRTP